MGKENVVVIGGVAGLNADRCVAQRQEGPQVVKLIVVCITGCVVAGVVTDAAHGDQRAICCRSAVVHVARRGGQQRAVDANRGSLGAATESAGNAKGSGTTGNSGATQRIGEVPASVMPLAL